MRRQLRGSPTSSSVKVLPVGSRTTSSPPPGRRSSTPGAGAGLGRGPGVEVLGVTVDRQQRGLGRRHPRDVHPGRRGHLEVAVRDPTGELLETDAVAQHRHAVQPGCSAASGRCSRAGSSALPRTAPCSDALIVVLPVVRHADRLAERRPAGGPRASVFGLDRSIPRNPPHRSRRGGKVGPSPTEEAAPMGSSNLAATGDPGRPALSLDQLRTDIAAGDIDTVLVCITDMQGRLQGKRRPRAVLPRRRHRPRHRGLQLPARRRRRHEHRGRLQHVVVATGYGDLVIEARTSKRCAGCRGTPARRWSSAT